MTLGLNNSIHFCAPEYFCQVLGQSPSNLDFCPQTPSELCLRWNELPCASALWKRLGHQFSDSKLAFQPFVHTSFIHEWKGNDLQSNERLEFLGDSIVNSIVTHYLWSHYPNMAEGDLSKLRGSIVNEQSFGALAEFLELGNCLLVGKGELKNTGYLKPSVTADAFEALFGALYLDSDFKRVTKVLLKVIADYEKSSGVNLFCDSRLLTFDARSRLQEEVMRLYKSLPQYREEKSSNGQFTIALYINDHFIERVTTDSKKRAIRALATKAMKEELYLGLDDSLNNQLNNEKTI